ncbi:MAG: S8 family serine peptidase [Pseudomonadota bacterium]
MTFSESNLIDGDWNFKRALMLAMLADASYSSGDDLKFILEEDLELERIAAMPDGANQGFVAKGDRIVVLAYSGTNQISDWLTNLKFAKSDISWGEVHTGFLEAYQIEEDTARMAADLAKQEGKVLWITGHSLGGALAHIAGHELIGVHDQIGLATFGQPRTVKVGDDKLLQNRLPFGYHRVVNENDLVPRVPPNLPHTGDYVQLGRRRRLFGLEGEDDGQSEAELPPLTEEEFKKLQAQLEQVARNASGAGEAAEAAIDRSVEGLIPGLRNHRMSAYLAALEKVAGSRDAGEVFEGLLSRPTAPEPEPTRRSSRRASGDVAGDIFGGGTTASVEGLFDDAPESASGAVRSARSLVEAVEDEAADAPGIERLPVLLQLADDSWAPAPSMLVLSRTGEFVTVLCTAEDVEAMEKDPKVRSVEISRAGGFPELATSMPFVKGMPTDRPDIDERGAHALVGVIDTGIDVMHDAFVDGDQKTRIVAIWDQLDPKGPSPMKVDPAFPFDFGTLHTAEDVTAMRSGATPPPAWLRDPSEHGTHVSGIAAGRATGDLPDGMAPDAPIAVVIPDMETISGNPASLGYSVSHKNALEFLRALALEKNKLVPDPTPIAINVSLGMNAGAHDGQTLLEAAFDGTTAQGRDPGIVIVKSAGNERPHRGHAHVDVAIGRVDVDWTSRDIRRGLDYFEAWYFKLDVLDFVLHSPRGGKSDVVSKKVRGFSGEIDGNQVQMRLRPRHPDNGDNVLYVSIGPGSEQIRPGVWSLEVRGRRISGNTTGLNMWVERSGDRAVEFDNAIQKMTLSVPGTANHIVTVGATDTADEFPGVIRASSFGPTRDGRAKPELSAPGRGIVSAHAGQSDPSATVAKTGTSMAAPHVTGAVALALSRRVAQGRSQFNSEQISALLIQSVQFTAALHHHGFGYGILDVASFLELCDEEP